VWVLAEKEPEGEARRILTSAEGRIDLIIPETGRPYSLGEFTVKGQRLENQDRGGKQPSSWGVA